MKSWNRLAAIISTWWIILPSSAIAETGSTTDWWYNIFVVWGPLILMLAWLAYILKYQATIRKRSIEHMDRTEQLLERIANAVEKDRR